MKRFLLHDGVTREQVEAHFAQLGWLDLHTSTTSPEVIAYKNSWAAPSMEDVGNYLENLPLSCSYVFASNGAFEELQASFDAAGLALAAAQVLAQPLAEGPEALRTLGRLGLLAHGSLDPKVFAKLSAALIHPHRLWQRYALYSLSNTSWSEFEPVLEKTLEAGGFAGDLEAFARSMLDSLRSANWNHDLYAE